MDHTHAQISNLVYDLFRMLDEKNDLAVAAAFAPNGVWHRQGVELTGHAEIVRALAAREADRQTVHVISNLLIHPRDNDCWTARYYLTAYLAAAPAPLRAVAILDCRDEIERGPDGLRILLKTSQKLGDLAT